MNNLAASTHRGEGGSDAIGNTQGWIPLALSTSRGNSALSATSGTVAGPTAGVELSESTEFLSPPVDQDFTISGGIEYNIWGLESSMNANCAPAVIVERVGSDGVVVSVIHDSRGVWAPAEWGTSAAVRQASGFTPTSTDMKKGDRIRVRVLADDNSGTGNMGSGFTASLRYNGPTAGADGDSFVRFTENFGFIVTGSEAGSQLFLTDVAGPAIGANVEKEMWTSRGDGVNSVVRNTAAGWTTPLQWTDSAGGTPVEWYSRQLAAFTLSNSVGYNVRVAESNAAANAGVGLELAVCDADGSNAVVWGADRSVSNGTGEAGTTESAFTGSICGPDLAVSAGQRLRLRVFVDDMRGFPLVTGHTVTLWYDGTSGGASGDSFITLSQTVSEFVATNSPPPPRRDQRIILPMLGPSVGWGA